MITLAKAEMLVTDERQRGWSYVLEGQTLRLLQSYIAAGRGQTAIEIIDSIVQEQAAVTPS